MQFIHESGVQVPVVVPGVQGLDSVTLMKESGAAGDY